MEGKQEDKIGFKYLTSLCPPKIPKPAKKKNVKAVRIMTSIQMPNDVGLIPHLVLFIMSKSLHSKSYTSHTFHSSSGSKTPVCTVIGPY